MPDRPVLRRLVVLGVLAVLLSACEFSTQRPVPPPTGPPPVGAAAPAISIDQRWTTVDGTWTFTGRLDPGGAPTDVILEIGHDIANQRSFEREEPVAQDVMDVGQISVDVEVPSGRPNVCVRFTATNEVGSGSSQPFCVSTTLPGSSVVLVSPAPSPSS